MPGTSGSDAHPYELEPTANAPSNSNNAEGTPGSQPKKLFSFLSKPDVNKHVCKQCINTPVCKQRRGLAEAVNKQ